MPPIADAHDFQHRLERLEILLREAEQHGDPAARSRLQEIVQTLLDLHGTGLQRLLEHLPPDRLETCAGDTVVSGLLLLHGLHPRGVEERVRQALDSVRPALRAHGGGVELLELRDGVVRLRLDGNCHGCPSSAATMQQTVEEAIYGWAPEVNVVEVEGLAAPGAVEDNRIALPVL